MWQWGKAYEHRDQVANNDVDIFSHEMKMLNPFILLHTSLISDDDGTQS